MRISPADRATTSVVEVSRDPRATGRLVAARGNSTPLNPVEPDDASSSDAEDEARVAAALRDVLSRRPQCVPPPVPGGAAQPSGDEELQDYEPATKVLLDQRRRRFTASLATSGEPAVGGANVADRGGAEGGHSSFEAFLALGSHASRNDQGPGDDEAPGPGDAPWVLKARRQRQTAGIRQVASWSMTLAVCALVVLVVAGILYSFRNQPMTSSPAAGVRLGSLPDAAVPEARPERPGRGM